MKNIKTYERFEEGNKNERISVTDINEFVDELTILSQKYGITISNTELHESTIQTLLGKLEWNGRADKYDIEIDHYSLSYGHIYKKYE